MGGAVLLGCWATGRPHGGLAGWASSMERLIPARTKSVPVVLLEQQQHRRTSCCTLHDPDTDSDSASAASHAARFRSDRVVYLWIWI